MGLLSEPGFSGLLHATLGLLTALLGGMLWFPKLYMALPITLATGIVYALYVWFGTRGDSSTDAWKFQMTVVLCGIEALLLFCFFVGGIIASTHLCTLATYAEWLWGGINPCGICISGNVFLLAATCLWIAAAVYTSRGAKRPFARWANDGAGALV